MNGISLALRQAQRSQCRFRVGAVIAQGSRILAAAPNKRRNSPTIDFRHSTFHAEEAALRRVADAAGRDIYVARIGAANAPLLARPCPRCLQLLRDVGIARAFYTIGPGLVGVALPGEGSSSREDDVIRLAHPSASSAVCAATSTAAVTMPHRTPASH